MSERSWLLVSMWTAVAAIGVAEAAWHRTVDAAIIVAVVAAMTSCAVMA